MLLSSDAPRPPVAGPLSGTPPEDASEATLALTLRQALLPLLEALAGRPPRPVTLMRRIGLDKSLASRLVQAARAESDQQFLHVLPSPTGLRILIERSRQDAAALAWLPGLARAVDAFADLLDALPGGRQALDARLGQGEASIRERREHMARQATFKAASYLGGHCAHTLVSSLFMARARDGGELRAVEVHQILGLQRVSPGTPLPLLTVPSEGEPIGDASLSEPIALAAGAPPAPAAAFFLPNGCTPDSALGSAQLVAASSGDAAVLWASEARDVPARLAMGLQWRSVGAPATAAITTVLRRYPLHTPCQRLVRELYLADDLWPDAVPHIGVYLPGTSASGHADGGGSMAAHRRLAISAGLQPVEAASGPPALGRVDGHRDLLMAVCRQAALAETGWRGWRCDTAYPVPLTDLVLALRHAATL